jgi:ubiquinone/menaquinone biosynthesis C-methylase UbiE
MPEVRHERRFHGEADRLRSAERIALLEVERVAARSVEGLTAHRVLDVGTGTGIFAQAFAARGYAVAGIDANGDLLKLALRFVPEGEFMEASAEAIPYGNGAFDLVFLGHVLHETDDPALALREARRVSTARVVVLEWPYLEEEHGPPLEHRLRPETIQDMARQAGLDRVERLRLTHMELYRMAVRPKES